MRRTYETTQNHYYGTALNASDETTGGTDLLCANTIIIAGTYSSKIMSSSSLSATIRTVRGR